MAESEEIADKIADVKLKTHEDDRDKFEDSASEFNTDNGSVKTIPEVCKVVKTVTDRVKDKSGEKKCESDEEYFSLGEDEDEEKEDEAEKINDEEYRRSLEETLSDDEKLERKNKAQELKDDGNDLFRGGVYEEAIERYTEALKICPYSFPKERSIMFSNRSACHTKLENDDQAIKDCNSALELHPHYLKALLRRAELYEKTEKLEEAMADYQKAVELDPAQSKARISCMKLKDQINERNEKLKAEMMGKLKDLGNLVLKPFGLSTDNFQLQQQEGGGYSVNFKQN